MKTMAIKLEDELHAQLALIAQLDGVPIIEEIRQALDTHIERKRNEPDFAQRAEAILGDLDRELAARRQAIQTLFSSPEPSTEDKPTRSRSTKRTDDQGDS